MRLAAYILLRVTSCLRCYFLFPHSLESTRKVVRQYDLAFFYRDCLDGTLRGFMLAGQAHIEKDGKHYCLMRVRGQSGPLCSVQMT